MPSGQDAKWIQAPELRVNINTYLTPQRKTPDESSSDELGVNEGRSQTRYCKPKKKMKNMKPEFRTSKVRQEQEFSNLVMNENHPEKKMLKIQMPRPAL